jgi:hypothetical protein
MDSNGSATPAPGCGVSLSALAEQRGISKDVARRLVKAGKVSAHQTAGTHGLEWCVHSDEPPPWRNGDAGPAPGVRNGSASVVDLTDLIAMVDRLTIENRQFAEAAATWQTRALMLADQLALSAPQSPPEAPGATTGPAPATDAPVPWWRGWWPWLLVAPALAAFVGLLAWPR